MLGQLRFAAFVIAIVLVIVLLSCSLRRSSPGATAAAAPGANRHVAEASKWASIAASETNPLLRLLHTNYALVAAKVGADEGTTSLSAGEMAAFVARLEAMQATSLKQLSKMHPKLKSDVQLAKAAGWV